ncbi:hypothetical protein BBI17_002105 [Phytophthora kernoviae]|uniref:Uncharacterized protein n=3 Tax=Phytophthora kernoviae TaxID=325452 RepID=A0A3R7H8H0_9STRA|nr:hypothetical protein G195_004065 [Phytophthora kernoviae 00238/432]KAG2528083.1 hypothetical protein JM16_003068 [Phytophthora kernoviae]KAG2529802.1 hypothetical protein JM18_002685 [Phytophthora kernoviae]RLN32677.1 hypothetical protein BBI17_002105 [Phytophthora kernoviae]
MYHQLVLSQSQNMRRRYERRRAAKAKAAAAATATAATENAALTATGPAETSFAANTSTPIIKKRQTTVHAAAQIKLLVHGFEFQNGEEIVLNPESFPQLKELVWKDYVVEVFHPEPSGELQMRQNEGVALAEGSPQNHLLLEIPESSAAPLKGKMQVSVLKDTAAMFQLAPFKDVTVRFLPKAQVEVDFVEVSLKDQFMSRRDLMYLKDSMVGTALYVEKTVRVQGTRWQVLDIRAGGAKVRSGVVSANTKFTFRSRTSRIMWLVQISPEMWDMANSGKLYLEIFLDVVRNVLNKWMKHSVSHSLTILFYSRCYYPEMDKDQDTSSHHRFTPKRRQSRAVEDERESSFPQITDVQPLLVKLKEEMNAFPLACDHDREFLRMHVTEIYLKL